jgi:predicted enzyme related to lactoylglutathione lyase
MLTTSYVPGVPVWLDLGARHIDAAADFYHRLFGWEFVSAGPEAGGYGTLRLDGRAVAAIGPLTDEGATPSWDLYFHTLDADATAAAVRAAGGTVRFDPFDVFDLGRMAGFTDPAGADFSVWQPGANRGLDAVGEVNTLCWTELYTTDAAAAKDFYRAVLRWESADAPVGGVPYTLASPTGQGRDAAHAGIMQLPPENVAAGTASGWHPYFEVADCDGTAEAAEAHGATAMIPPTDMPGVGRLAMFADPAGARFAVVHSSADSMLTGS